MNQPPLRIYVYQENIDDILIVVREGRETLAKERVRFADVLFANDPDINKPFVDAIAKISKATGIKHDTIAKGFLEGDNKMVFDRLWRERNRLRRPPPVSMQEPPPPPDPEPEKTGWEGFLENIGKAMQRSALPKARVVKGGRD